MKRVLLLAGLLAVGCAQSEVNDVNVPASERISLSATTTRAASTVITGMQQDAAGFRVFAIGGDVATTNAWYPGIDGTNNHRYGLDGVWNFGPQVPWPTAPGQYPLTFYAWYPAAPAEMGALVATPGASPTLTAPFTLQTQATAAALFSSQQDVLAAKATASIRPAVGHLSFPFRHIFAKVNFGIIPGNGTTAYIQSMGLYDAFDTRTFDFAASAWINATSYSTGNVTIYPYYGTNDWAHGGAANLLPRVRLAGTDATETTAMPFYASITNQNLLVIPQTSATWVPAIGSSPGTGDGTLIYLLYYLTANQPSGDNDPNRYPIDEVGYADARRHPNYEGSDLAIANYTGPLYVLAGFPLPATGGNFTWEQGKGYTYNIALGTLGSCNGYLIEDTYYDENGKKTTLPIRDSREVGEKLKDGEIYVKLVVEEWVDDHNDQTPAGTITYSREVLALLAEETTGTNGNIQSFTVTCKNFQNGPDPTRAWSLNSPEDWLRLTFNADATASTPNLSGVGNQTVYVVIVGTPEPGQYTLTDAAGQAVIYVNVT